MPTEVLFAAPARALSRRAVQAFARTLEAQVTRGRSFTCLVTSDAELRRLNRTFRNRDEPTDVLSFPAESPAESLGEIAISLHRARAQAAEFGHPLSTEIEILMLHGVLHLLGMDHEKDRGQMSRAEKKWRTKLDLPPSLIERARKTKPPMNA